MADDSELDYLKTFIGEVTTSLTVNSYEDKRKLMDVTGEKKCLIEPGELLSVDGSFYKKRYKIKLSLENEANVMSILNEIIEGIFTYNSGASGLTKVSVMCNLKFAYSNKAWVTSKGRWEYDIYIDVEWSTS